MDDQEHVETVPFPPAPRALADRFELLGEVGEGGMGVVFEARDRELDELVAVKVLQRSFTRSEGDVARFKREIKTARRITHPNVIRIHEFGIVGGEAFICMELLSGGSLAEKLAAGRVGLDEALDVATQIAAGVGAAHAHGIVHRDLKPHNVLFDENGVVKLLDFGIARFTASTTFTMGLVGTPHYMSPEQCDTGPVTERSDVYSLGVLLFELFTGELPFVGDSILQLAKAHAATAPPRPRDVDGSVPAEIERIILKALSKKPEDRFADAAEVEQALRAVGTDAVRARPPQSSRWRRWLATSGIGLIVMALGVALTLEVRQALRGQPAGARSAAPVVATADPVLEPVPMKSTSRAKAVPNGTWITVSPRPDTDYLIVRVSPNPDLLKSRGPGSYAANVTPGEYRVTFFFNGREIIRSTTIKAGTSDTTFDNYDLLKQLSLE